MAHACDVAQRLRIDAVTEGSVAQRDRYLALAPEAEAASPRAEGDRMINASLKELASALDSKNL